MADPKPQPWYQDGLSFACSRCGNCCTGSPGYVWLSVDEMQSLAGHLGLEFEQFTQRFVRQVENGYSLIEKPNHDCVFWDAAVGCTVYEARPMQCRTWPFWPAHLESPQSWQRTQAFCPGCRGDGPVFAVEEIEAQARRAALAMRR